MLFNISNISNPLLISTEEVGDLSHIIFIKVKLNLKVFKNKNE